MTTSQKRSDFTILSTFVERPPLRVHIARSVGGNVVELIERAPVDDDDYVWRFGAERLTDRPSPPLLPDDVRVPHLFGRSFRDAGALWCACVHRPSISFVRLVHEATMSGGLAVPLVVSIAIDVLEVLTALGGDSYGSVYPEALAVTVDGTARFVTLEQVGHNDVVDLGRLLKRIATGAGPYDDSHALELAPDMPIEFALALESLIHDRLSVVAALDTFTHAGLTWARWTKPQVADELRALFPDASR